jgi:hypothetical protein
MTDIDMLNLFSFPHLQLLFGTNLYSCALKAILRRYYYYPNQRVSETCISFGDNPGKISRTSKLSKKIRMQFTSLNDQPVFLLFNYTHIMCFKPYFLFLMDVKGMS